MTISVKESVDNIQNEKSGTNEQREKSREQLKIAKEIRAREEDIVIAIEKALDEGKYPQGTKDSALLSSQFRNLVRVADTTESPAVVKNFLRYQVGRDQKWGRGKGSLAEKIINDVDEKLLNYAQEVAQQASSTNVRSIHMQMIRLYLGYGSRRLKYRSLTAEEQV